MWGWAGRWWLLCAECVWWVCAFKHGGWVERVVGGLMEGRFSDS